MESSLAISTTSSILKKFLLGNTVGIYSKENGNIEEMLKKGLNICMQIRRRG
jgi:hypothetical protein